jgi:hypothetical protein
MLAGASAARFARTDLGWILLGIATLFAAFGLR